MNTLENELEESFSGCEEGVMEDDTKANKENICRIVDNHVLTLDDFMTVYFKKNDSFPDITQHDLSLNISEELNSRISNIEKSMFYVSIYQLGLRAQLQISCLISLNRDYHLL